MNIPEELLEKILSGNCVLFIGAGASISAGAPTSNELAKEISKKYLQGHHIDESLSRISAYVEAKPGFGRVKIIDLLLNKLTQLTISDSHLVIPKINWPAIYTTNYDTLIEKAYEKYGIRCKAITSSKDLIINSQHNSKQVFVYKPHGCILKPESLVVSEDDYYTSTVNRMAIYRQLEIHKYKNTFLFVGYSFSDFDLSRIWFDVSREIDKYSVWSYALWPGCTEEQKNYWLKKNVVLIDLRFDELMTHLNDFSNDLMMIRTKAIEVNEVVEALLISLNAINPDKYKHSIIVEEISTMIANEIKMGDEEKQLLKIASLLHDIGFIKIDYNFEKKNMLTAPEWEIIKRHSEYGELIVSSLPSLRNISSIIRSHHERYDGFGYPDRLKQTEIPFISRVIHVADMLSAMIVPRPYRKALTIDETLLILNESKYKEFDPVIVTALQKLYEDNKLTDVISKFGNVI